MTVQEELEWGVLLLFSWWTVKFVQQGRGCGFITVGASGGHGIDLRDRCSMRITDSLSVFVGSRVRSPTVAIAHFLIWTVSITRLA